MLQISHLSFAYEQGPYLLHDLSMEIHDGDYVAIVGENGSGKSTLVKLILGLLSPSSGTISCTFRRPAYVPQPTDMINKQSWTIPGKSSRSKTGMRWTGPWTECTSLLSRIISSVPSPAVSTRR